MSVGLWVCRSLGPWVRGLSSDDFYPLATASSPLPSKKAFVVSMEQTQTTRSQNGQDLKSQLSQEPARLDEGTGVDDVAVPVVFGSKLQLRQDHDQ